MIGKRLLAIGFQPRTQVEQSHRYVGGPRCSRLGYGAFVTPPRVHPSLNTRLSIFIISCAFEYLNRGVLGSVVLKSAVESVTLVVVEEAAAPMFVMRKLL